MYYAGGYADLAHQAFSKRRWRDPTPTKPAERRELDRRQQCAASPQVRQRMREIRRTSKRRFYRHRAQMRDWLATVPYRCGSHGRFALPCELVACESGYDIRARNSTSTAGGYGQAIDSTWVAYGGTDYADSHPAAVAPKREQDEVFAAIWSGGSGSSHWDASRHCWG